MALGANLPVRLEADVEKRLEEIAAKTGTTKSALIRLLAKVFTDQFWNADKIEMPPNVMALLENRDDRSAPDCDPDASSTVVKVKVQEGIQRVVYKIRKQRKFATPAKRQPL